jgi:hypothetical protein
MSVDTKRKRLARVAAVIAIVGGAGVALGWFGGSNDEGAPVAHATYDLARPGTTVVLRVLAPVLY